MTDTNKVLNAAMQAAVAELVEAQVGPLRDELNELTKKLSERTNEAFEWKTKFEAANTMNTRHYSTLEKLHKILGMREPFPQEEPELAKAIFAAQGQNASAIFSEIGKLSHWKHCMSYNTSYFGEPAGLLKQTVYELDRLIGKGNSL